MDLSLVVGDVFHELAACEVVAGVRLQQPFFILEFSDEVVLLVPDVALPLEDPGRLGEIVDVRYPFDQVGLDFFFPLANHSW